MNSTFSEGLPAILSKKMQMEFKQANAVAHSIINKTKYGAPAITELKTPDESLHEKQPPIYEIEKEPLV